MSVAVTESRLQPSIEVDSLIRRAETAGGFGAIIRKGDAMRGSILILITERGKHISSLERQLGIDGHYGWQTVGPEPGSDARTVSEFAQKRVKFDEDVWLIELDVPHPQRFIAGIATVG